MRLPIAFAVVSVLTIVLATPPASASDAPRPGIAAGQQEFSAAQKRKKRTDKRGHNARASGGQQIACTFLGCHPIPRGCRIETRRIPFTWEPSGFDEVVCPYRR